MPKVRYVGHVVSEHGIEPDPDKIEKVKSWPTPTTPEEVRRFLGFVGYYRRFVKDFSRIGHHLSKQNIFSSSGLVEWFPLVFDM
jgi:hypothetical protein